MNTIIKVNVRVKKKNDVIFYIDVETSIELNKFKELGPINGKNNLKAINLLFGSQFIEEEIIDYTGYKQ